MAMTKKEQAAMQAAIDRADLLAALRWTEQVEKDVPPPSCSWNPVDGVKSYTEGWIFNTCSKKVDQVWSEYIYHGYGPYPEDSRARSASQNSISMFSTKLLALKGLRHAIERQAAADLLAIDRLIEAEKSVGPK